MNLIKVGKLVKPFGTKGFVKVHAEKKYLDDLCNTDVWFVDFRGDTIPYFIEKIDKSSNFLVKFEDLDNPEDAKKISGAQLFLKQKDISKKETNNIDTPTLIGFTIKNSEQTIGTIADIIEYPQQTMAVIYIKENDILIPLHAAMIIDINIELKTIEMELPEGLIESQIE
ncbi:MAG: ribosome maturation factor RimM [Saprospiraceae bacterium]